MGNMFSKFIKTSWRKIAAGIVLCLIAAVLVVNYENQRSAVPTIATSAFASKPNTVTLTITGEVVKPGVYQVKAGSSIMDNIHEFGGFTMYADISKIDVDAPLTKDKTLSVKSRSAIDKRNYDSLYVMPD